MDGVCKIMAELMYNLLDLLVVFGCECVSNDLLKPVDYQHLMHFSWFREYILKSSNFPFVVKFIIQSTLNGGVHHASALMSSVSAASDLIGG